MSAKKQYKRVTDSNGEAYLCETSYVRQNESDFASTEACFEADVAGRYASDIDIVR
jgi:hypothetical protein